MLIVWFFPSTLFTFNILSLNIHLLILHSCCQTFFYCSALRHLYLKECEIQLPWFFKGFNKLIRLKFKCVTLSSNTFEILISNNTLLEDLVLKDIDNPYLVSTNAPKLRSFVFRGDIQLIYLENVHVLSNVLYAPWELVLEDKDDFVSIFSSIHAL